MRAKLILLYTIAESRAKIWLDISPPVAPAALRSKVVVLLLFILAPTVCGSFWFDPCFVVSFLVLQSPR